MSEHQGGRPNDWHGHPCGDSTTVAELKASPPTVGINRPLRVPKKFQHQPPANHPDTGEKAHHEKQKPLPETNELQPAAKDRTVAT